MSRNSDSLAELRNFEEGKTFLGHPRGLFVLFFAEMWERFSYYGMRALLIFYLTKHWLFSDREASMVYGAYTALVYIGPVLGGYLADRYLGQRKAVQFGAVLLTCGHFLMAFEGDGGQGDATINVFWLALALIIVGSGFLKANISVLVGQLYPRTDVRRDPAYTLFYMGINLGAALGALVAGWLGETYGWSWGFGSAGVGMLLGLLVFVWGRPALKGRGEPPAPEELAAKGRLGLTLERQIYLFSLLSLPVVWCLLQYQALVGALLGISGALLLLYVLTTAVRQLSRDERQRIYAMLYLCFGSILFWALFEQAGSSLNLFTERSVDRHILGWEPKASQLQSLNSIYIILLGPVFAWLWQTLGRRGWEPSAPAKFALGVVQVGLGFLVLVAGAKMAGGGLTPILYIFLLYLLHTTGELCLSPVGLSAMNRLSPVSMASLIMGAWFLASAAGDFSAGLIAAATGGEDGNLAHVLGVYSRVGWLALAVGGVMLLISPWVRRLMHLESLSDDPSELAGQREMGEAQAGGSNLVNERTGST